MKPLAIDLFCGLGGWTDGLLAAGLDVAGFDITRHEYARLIQHRAAPTETVIDRYPAQLVLQDILTVHGSQFRDAAVIVASPPCQAYSYLAMPWSRSTDPENSKAAKALRKKWETEGPDNRLFDACFRIQREACKAAASYIPLIVENVRGAVPWVGREKAKFSSFYLWGDVGMVGNRVFAGRDLTDVMAGRGRFGMGVAPETGELKGHGSTWFGIQSNGDTYDQREVNPVSGQKRNPDGTAHPQGSWFRIADSSQGDRATKTPGRSLSKGAPNKFGTHNMGSAEKIFAELEGGTKIGGDWFRDPACHSKHGSGSNARKAASAMIAKIPYALSRYIADQHFPADLSGTARVNQ